MKLLHVLGELKPSGAETMLYAAGPLLKDYGIEAEILSAGTQIGPYAEQLASAGYTLHHVAFKRSPLFFWSVFKLLKRNRYDVIHLHTEGANFWFGIIALLTGKRCLRTIHATFAFLGFLRWKRKWQRQLLSRMGLTHVAISQSVQDTEWKHYQLRTPVILNWYNSLRFRATTPQQRIEARAKLNLPTDSFILLTIGNCAQVKNHVELIKAMAAITQPNWIYLHVGIESSCVERDLATDLNIANQIRFCGLQTDILPYLQAADLFVMPSLYEGFGVAVIEAIATGLPALLTRVPGLIDFDRIFKGLSYCEPNAGAIADALTEIMKTSPESLHQHVAENSQITEERFGIQRGLSSYIEIYKS